MSKRMNAWEACEALLAQAADLQAQGYFRSSELAVPIFEECFYLLDSLKSIQIDTSPGKVFRVASLLRTQAERLNKLAEVFELQGGLEQGKPPFNRFYFLGKIGAGWDEEHEE